MSLQIPRSDPLFDLLTEPTRVAILAACRRRPSAAKGIAEHLGLPVENVAHHVRVLLNAGVLAVHSTRRHRATQTFYVLAERHDLMDEIERAAETLESLAAELRAMDDDEGAGWVDDGSGFSSWPAGEEPDEEAGGWEQDGSGFGCL